MDTNQQQTTGYIKWMMLYKGFDKNMLPKEIKNNDQSFLQAINTITNWQAHK